MLLDHVQQDPAQRRVRAVAQRTRRRIEQHYRARTKRAFWSVADRLDPGRMGRLVALPARPAVPGTRARA